MAVPQLPAGLFMEPATLGRLKVQARTDRQSAEAEAAQQFEALFIHQMFKQMRAMQQGGLFDSPSMRLYRDWFDQQVAGEMARAGGLGLADAIRRQWSPPGSRSDEQARPMTAAEVLAVRAKPAQPPARTTQAAPRTSESASRVASAEQAVRPVSTEPVGDGWRTGPEAFVKSLLPHARKAAAALGVHPGLLLAQAALETGWGRHLPVAGDGREAVNLFGIKAGGGWQGPVVESDTLEVRQSVVQRERAAFLDFGTLERAFDGLVDFLRGNPRYQPVLQAAPDPEAWARGLQQAGYATDPQYADKILSILRRPAFRQWLQQAGAPLENGLKFFLNRPIRGSEPAL